jgi:hypothetical protein
MANCLDKHLTFFRNSQYMKTSIPPVLIAIALFCFALVQNAQAVSLPPDGGYPGANTAEGNGALFHLTTGTNNTAVGSETLFSLTTGSQNTATGAQALKNNTASGNTATGWRALFTNTTGSSNTAVGSGALYSDINDCCNTAIGRQALFSNSTGGMNTAVGEGTLADNTTGGNNTAIGADAILHNISGTGNIAIGVFAGQTLATGHDNIYIGNYQVSGQDESNTIRIGISQGTTYITGISETPLVGAPVVVADSNQLGVQPSSARFKEQIEPMDKASETVFSLKPVTFHYKEELDSKRNAQFGLVAEDVENVDPDLVVHDKGGKPYTVRYDAVNAMLLNEFLKEHKAALEEHRKVEKLEATVAGLVAKVKGQAAQIQKVSTQLETSKPAPQVVNNP